MKEFREVVNSSFYGNENENMDNITNIEEEKNIKIKEININKDDLKKGNINEKKDENILMFKTPNKEDKSNQENTDGNIIKNMDLNAIQKNLNFLFEQ